MWSTVWTPQPNLNFIENCEGCCSVAQELTHLACQWILWSQLGSEDVSCQLQMERKIQPHMQSLRNINLNLQQIIPATSPRVQLGFSLPANKWQETN